MNTPYPDPGEEYQHINTQLFGHIYPPSNRGVLAERMIAPYNAPVNADQVPSMDGFVIDYISAFIAEMGRQPTYDEYSQIMTGYTPEQMPVLSVLARGGALSDIHQPLVFPRWDLLRPGRQLAVRELPSAQQC